MKKTIAWIVPVVVVVVLGAFWYWKKDNSAAPEATPPDAATTASEQPAVNYPITADAGTQATPLPALDDDAAIASSLEGAFGHDAVMNYLIPMMIVRHAVATIDNLPRKKLAVQLRPIHGASGKFITNENDSDLTLKPENYARYRPFVQVVQAMDVKQVGDWYRHHYALFQEAYVGLGYPKGYFNDRLVQVIDDLLATPDVSGPIKLVQPNVFYQFADPDLEARSAGQKTLLRMGPENMAALKAKLRELRAEVTRPSP